MKSVRDLSSLLPQALLVAVIVGFPVPSLAQEGQEGEEQPENITLTLDAKTRARLRIAVPRAASGGRLSEAAQEPGRQLMDVLRADLEASGVFAVQGPEQLEVLEFTGDETRDFALFQSLGNELLLDTALKEEGGLLVLEGRIFQLSGGEAILGKRYRGSYDLARRIAHTFADEIVRYFTGRRGVALTAIAFHSDRDGVTRRGDLGREVYLMDYDGWNQRKITAHETMSMFPAWSPAGDVISYVTYVGDRTLDLYLVDIRTGAKTPLVTGGNYNSSPAFSPDGRKIAFTRSVAGGNTEIYLCNRDGSNLQRLTTARGIDTNPAWSPTGREIAFTSSRSGKPQIYVMSAEGTDLRRATFTGDYNDGAAWSPDGGRIAHSSRRRSGTSFDLALTDLTTDETRLLTEGQPGSHEAPSFSPDGRKIAYATTVSARSGTSTQIFVVDLAGGGRRQLTRGSNNWAPDWSGYLK
jgi:TolB protein